MGALTIRDKVEGQRTIPLTPYVAALLQDLKARDVHPLHLKPDEKWEPSPWAFSYRLLPSPGELRNLVCRRSRLCAAEPSAAPNLGSVIVVVINAASAPGNMI